MDVLMGKSSRNGPFSMAMLNNQMIVFFTKHGDFTSNNDQTWELKAIPMVI